MKRLIATISIIGMIFINVMPAHAYTAKDINGGSIRVYSSGVDINEIEKATDGYVYMDNRQFYEYMLNSKPFSYIEGVELMDIGTTEKDFIIKSIRRSLSDYLPKSDYVIAVPVKKDGSTVYPSIRFDDNALLDGDTKDYKDNTVIYRKGREEATKVEDSDSENVDFDIDRAMYYYSDVDTSEVMFISVKSGTKLSMDNFTYGSTTISTGLYGEDDKPLDTPVLEADEDIDTLRGYFWEDSEIVDYKSYKYGNYIEDHNIYKIPLSVLNEGFRNIQENTVIDNISDEDEGDEITVHEGINIVKFTTTAFNDAGFSYYMIVYGQGEEPIIEPEITPEPKKDVDVSTLIVKQEEKEPIPTVIPTPEPVIPETTEAPSTEPVLPYVIGAIGLFVIGGGLFILIFVAGRKLPKLSIKKFSKIKFNGVLDMDNPAVTVKGVVAGLPETDYSVKEMLSELNEGKITVSRMIKKIYMSGITSFLPGDTTMLITCNDEPMPLYEGKADENKLFSILMMYEKSAKERKTEFEVIVTYKTAGEEIIKQVYHIYNKE